MGKNKHTFFVVLLCTLALAYVAFFGLSIDAAGIHLRGVSEMRFGIDIRGGVDAAFAPKDLDRKPTASELDAARNIMEVRLNQKNILDRDVTVDAENGYIFVRFPWKADEADFDPDQAIAELGSMAHLTFRDPDGTVVLEGNQVSNTVPALDTQSVTGGYKVDLTLTSEGRAAFAEATRRLVGQQIAIYMDEVLISAPTVQSVIDSNECVINNLDSYDEAKTLSDQINAGALPFSLITQNYSAISPVLGSSALEVMVTAGLISFILICLALMLYYRLSGVVASVALLLQVAGQLVLLIWPQFTVTLSGIAGIILAIGMGVDANIIIAERLREELRRGKKPSFAVQLGFQRAFSSVFDGNITVLIVAVVMLIFGSGAILSFAYTLLFGIIMNFVAGVTATRLMTMSLVRRGDLAQPKYFLSKRLLEKKEVKVYPFFQRRKVFFAISACIMAIGLVMVAIDGVKLDIQFQGGAILKYSMSETVELNPEDAGQVAERALEEQLVTAQITTDYATQEKKLVLNMAGGDSLTNEQLQDVTEALQAAYPDQDFTLTETNNVAPFFSTQFLRNGVLSLLIAGVLVIAYVWFSFRKIHGLSAGAMALLSLLHDVLVVFFTFVIFQIPIGDSFIAVALTILGYSINDTIVIYDRIRENAQLEPTLPIEDLVNKSISQSFTRSLNTNLAVLTSVLLVYIFAALNGLESVRAFALPMVVGTISGCYSTVCIAGPTWAMWRRYRENAAKKA